jgi:glutathione-regulated potassium-efflux system protein KefB
MEGSHVLQYMVMFLAAAVVAVALSKRAGLGAVLGYLGAGAVLGPGVLNLAPDMSQTNELSELGVILLLFVIGLELSPARLWLMRRAVFGAGLLQVALSAAILGAIAVAVGALRPSAIVIGLALAMSSTAIGLQILAERKEIGEPHGRLAFAILLFQDLAAIPTLALVPLLGAHDAAVASGSTWLAAAKAIGMIALVAIGGRYLLRPVFRMVAATQITEVFTAMSLLVVFGAAWLMQLAGMQMSLGAFLAGVLLADSEFRHEIEAQIEPFRGLLLGLFFVGVGASLDLQLVKQQPMLVGAIVLCILLVKAAVLLMIGRLFKKLDFEQTVKLALVLAGGGEFAFVVLNLARDHELLGASQHSLLAVSVTLSMALIPVLVVGGGKLLANGRKAQPQREFDVIPDGHPRVIIAGYGRVGQIVARVLRAQRIAFTALESSVEQVELTRRFNQNIYFGDSSRPELLRAAGIEKAEVFVLTTDDPELNIRTARIVKRLYPHIRIVARARNRQHVWRLMDMNIDEIVRDTFYSSLVMAKGVLVDLGIAPEIAKARIDIFRKRDEQLLRDQHLVYDDEAALLQSSREALADLDRLFEADERPAEIEADKDENEDEQNIIPGTP